MRVDDLWNDMLTEFRALGGVAENIRMGHGPFGRGLFPIDPKKPVSISIPETLLVSLKDIYFEGDVFRVHSRSPVSARGQAFLAQYEQDFAWGVARHEVEQFLSEMSKLPERVREFATKRLGLGRFFVPIVPGLAQKWFFGTRGIRSDSGSVVMPIIEIANHGGAAAYKSESGISLSGTFEDEVLVRYTTPSDPYEMLTNWMFAPKESTAFSIEISGAYGGRDFQIKREFEDQEVPFVPNVSVEEGRVVVSYLLLGHRQFPRVPKGAFRKALQFLKLDDLDEIYDVIQFTNRDGFLELLDILQGLDLPAASILRTMAINQLAALSEHYGARSI
jgi:hypothetical protein